MNPAQMAVKIEMLATPIASTREGGQYELEWAQVCPAAFSCLGAPGSTRQLTHNQVERLFELELVAEEVESCIARVVSGGLRR